MHLSETDIDNYLGLLQARGKSVTREVARNELSKLVQITAIILKSSSGQDLQGVGESKNEN
ncbi:MAG: hypothetical protein HYY52_06765 [Candidatus Melainabacteria bacterium]|nr:hypothetical protein [Candidatus Melainabacteria bacterium]